MKSTRAPGNSTRTYHYPLVNGDKVDVWYDRRERLWVIQVTDADDCQYGNSDYAHTREVAESRAKVLQHDAEIALNAAAVDMLKALEIALRAPGIHDTDQTTGETYSYWIREAIAKAKVG